MFGRDEAGDAAWNYQDVAISCPVGAIPDMSNQYVVASPALIGHWMIIGFDIGWGHCVGHWVAGGGIRHWLVIEQAWRKINVYSMFGRGGW
jgi:hypothetical protein